MMAVGMVLMGIIGFLSFVYMAFSREYRGWFFNLVCAAGCLGLAVFVGYVKFAG